MWLCQNNHLLALRRSLKGLRRREGPDDGGIARAAKGPAQREALDAIAAYPRTHPRGLRVQKSLRTRSYG